MATTTTTSKTTRTKLKPMSAQQKMKTLEQNQKEALQYYKKQKRVEIYIPPMYAPYFGRVMTVSINGIDISVPCNGKRVKVPRIFADEIQSRMNAINKKRRIQTQLNEKNVFESSPGAKGLVS